MKIARNVLATRHGYRDSSSSIFSSSSTSASLTPHAAPLCTNENAEKSVFGFSISVGFFCAAFAYLFNAGRTTRQQRAKNIKAGVKNAKNKCKKIKSIKIIIKVPKKI